MIFPGVCSKQARPVTPGEYDLQVISVAPQRNLCYVVTYFTFYQNVAAPERVR